MLRELKEKAQHAEGELEESSGPNSVVKRLEDENNELRRQLRTQEFKTRSLRIEQSTSSAELATLRSQAGEHQNELQTYHEKVLTAERGRQEIQSELEKTKDALQKATVSAKGLEEFEELEGQILEAAETERALLKQLREADESARDLVERGIAEGEDIWIKKQFEVEQEWRGAKAKFEIEQEQLQVELYMHLDRNRYLEEENKKLRHFLMVGTPSPVSKNSPDRRLRKAADRSTHSIVNVERSHVPMSAPSTLPHSQGQVNSQSAFELDQNFFDESQEVLVPGTDANAFVEDETNDDFYDQTGTQVIPATFPTSYKANQKNTEKTAGVISQAPDEQIGQSQSDRVTSSHSEFHDFFGESNSKELSLIDKVADPPCTPRVSKTVAFQEGRPRSRANTGVRLSVPLSDSTPIPIRTRLSGSRYTPSINGEDEDQSTPDKTSQAIAKTYVSHAASSGSQSPRPSKRPASQTSTDLATRKKSKTLEIVSLTESQDTQESRAQGNSRARPLSQSTHVSETQSQSQSQSQRLSTPRSRMKSSHGRNASMTGPSQTVLSRRRRSASCKSFQPCEVCMLTNLSVLSLAAQMNDRFSQETRK
ncbi:hypothetical protein IWX47DRAFT_870430 [Phyllosticta citricarpa]